MRKRKFTRFRNSGDEEEMGMVVQKHAERSYESSLVVKKRRTSDAGRRIIHGGIYDSSVVVKKRRCNDAGRRIIHGRTYDSSLGKTCHWCRQKTVDDRVHCAAEHCNIKFCRKCLLNRHGEDIDEQMQEGVRWICPRCRGGCGEGCEINCCNCGPCRKAQGLEVTGQMILLARMLGFDNVHDYLIHRKTGESQQKISQRKRGRHWIKEAAIDRIAFPLPLNRAPPATELKPNLDSTEDMKLEVRGDGVGSVMVKDEIDEVRKAETVVKLEFPQEQTKASDEQLKTAEVREFRGDRFNALRDLMKRSEERAQVNLSVETGKGSVVQMTLETLLRMNIGDIRPGSVQRFKESR